MSYPRFRDKLHLQELRRFTLALGMQRDSLVRYLKPIDGNPSEYYSVSELHELLNNKTANQVLHRTYNVYSAEYNTHVIRKALQLLMDRRVTYTELQEIRTLFEAYESEDLEGMPGNEHTIFRILKHCGRAIAPLKLQHQLKKMKDEADTVGRLQLYELLDIIPYSKYTKDIEIPMELNNGTAKDCQSLYKVDNFHLFLYTFEERIKKQLDKDYKHVIARSYNPDQSSRMNNRINLIERDGQNAFEIQSKARYRNIKNTLKHSNNIIFLSRSGQFRPTNSCKQSTNDDLVTQQSQDLSLESSMVAVQHKTSLPPLISDKDLEKQSALMEELEWEMINNREKYKVAITKKLEELKSKKKFRDARNLFSQPPSTARRTADLFVSRASRPSTVNDAFDLYSAFEEDTSFRTKVTSSGTIDIDEGVGDVESVDPPFRDITLDHGYQMRKHHLLQKVKLIRQGKKLVDI